MRSSFRIRLLLIFPVALALIFGLSSCGNTRSLIYMQGSFDTARLKQVNAVEPVIRKGDILSIIVYSDNPAATQIYNQSLIAAAASGGSAASGGQEGGTTPTGLVGSSPSTPGYQVDGNGNIMFQGIGLIHVEGLTKANLQDTLNQRLTPFLTHPYYSVRFLNYKFTMLGEVNHPGLVSIPGEKINLLEAIALAGDLTFFARRDNVLIIRQNNNIREFARLDLTKPDIMISPYFYLQQNDMVIVEPTKKRVAANDVITTRNISIAATIVSTLAIVYSIFRK